MQLMLIHQHQQSAYFLYTRFRYQKYSKNVVLPMYTNTPRSPLRFVRLKTIPAMHREMPVKTPTTNTIWK